MDWLDAKDGTALAGWRAEGAAELGQVSPAPTTTAPPSKAVTVSAPTERRTASRARAPAMCHLPRDTTAKKIRPTRPTIGGRLPVCMTRLLPG